MSGWDETRRVELAEPWSDFWLDLWEDPPMGAWLEIQAKCVAAMRAPQDIALIRDAIATFGLLVADHNITDRSGKRIETFSLEALSSGLFRAILSAVLIQIAGVGSGSSDPLVKTALSPEPSLRARRSRRTSRSGA